MIYVFGNSHANTFTKTVPGNIGLGNENSTFKSFSLGPIIAFNFFEHHYPKVLRILQNENLGKDDYVLLAVGEVDCRWHLPYQANVQKLNIEEIVDQCVDRFFRAYIDLQKRGYNVIGWGSHPSTISEHNENPEQPVFGDCLSRNKIGLLWEKKLQKLCNIHDMKFLSIFHELIDENLLTKMEYFIDYCHLDPQKIENLLLKKTNEIIAK